MKFQRLHCVSQIGGHGFQKVPFCETFEEEEWTGLFIIIVAYPNQMFLVLVYFW
jgi:hypothetical protein